MQVMMKRVIKIVLFLIAAIGINIAAINFIGFETESSMSFKIDISASKNDVYQLFYSEGNEWTEEKSFKIEYIQTGQWQQLEFELPENTQEIRLDLGNNVGLIKVKNPHINYLHKNLPINHLYTEDEYMSNHIGYVEENESELYITSSGNDPYVIINLEALEVGKLVESVEQTIGAVFKVLVCIAINSVLLLFIVKRRSIFAIMKEVVQDRELIWKLSKNDFKTKYAGSYLGIIWAFVQPVVSILIYWFVFQVGFKSAPVEDFPFVLWLVMGLVPWFFFSDAVMGATNSLIEYSYLVKKVVFKISVLPIVKVISALFVHLFFLGFGIALFIGYGYYPDMYTLQIIYYMICLIALVLGISYATSAMILFFRDLGQIISIFMQVGMWMTPIMWSYNMITPEYQWILELNPMYYIVRGYRQSMIDKVWFWENANATVYFWVVCIILFGLGSLIFKKLKVHFADVL